MNSLAMNLDIIKVLQDYTSDVDVLYLLNTCRDWYTLRSSF